MTKKIQLLMVDNYDSFTYNIVQYFGELGADVTVVRNDEITVDEIQRRLDAGQIDRLVISPGPCSPAEAGISVAAIQHFAGQLPILGVSRSPEHRRGVWRQDHPCAGADARQDQRDHHHAGRCLC
jgi:anthranilate synthase component 2